MAETPANPTPPKGFFEQINELKPFLPTRYTPIVLQYYPEIDAQKLRYAMAGRVEYWEAIPGLRVAAGLDSPPRLARLNVQPRKSATTHG